MENGTFQWNAGGWFGAQLGGSCWMLVAAGIMFGRDVTLASITLAIFVAVNAIGIAIWTQRERVRPLPAMQGLILLEGIAAVLATFILDSAGHFETLAVGGQVSANSMYIVLALMIPALLLMFHLIERGGREND